MRILGFEIQRRASLNVQHSPGYKIDEVGTWDLLGGSPTTSGITVNTETALTFSAVWAAIRLLSDSISTLPFSIIDKQGDYRKVVSNHRLSNLIHLEPNELMTSKTLRWVLVALANLTGNGYAIIGRDQNADVISITPVHSDNVTIVEREGKIFYKVKGNRLPIPAMDMIHIKAFTLDGILGLSPIANARETIGSGIAAQRETGKMFSSGANINGLLEAPGMVNEDQMREIKRAFKRNSKDGIAILTGGLKYNRMSIPPVDAQWIEQRRLTIEDVARIFRVPPHLIGDLSRSTNNNIEAQGIEFVIYSLTPWAVEIEQEFDRKIFRIAEKGKFGTRLNMNALMRGDMAARSVFYQRGILSGYMTPNEVRILEDTEPKGADGDILIYPVNMTTMEKLKAMPAIDTNTQTDEGEKNI